MVLLTLPVGDLADARRFWSGMGFRVDDAGCDGEVVSVAVGGRMLVLLASRHRFAELVPAPVAEARACHEVVTSLSATSRAEVDALADRAVALGGTALRTSQQGPVYGRSFADPDGHVWELLHVAA